MDPSMVMAGANMVQGQMAQRQAMGMNLAGMAWNTWMQNRQNEWNANQMALQNQWNIDQWNRENAYNTPLAQMQRLVAAGINPALAYSEGGLMNEAAASPAMQASQGKAYMVDPLSFAQIQLMSAQAEKLIGDNRRADEAQPLTLEKLRSDIAVAKGQLDVQKASVSKMTAEEQLAYAQKTLTELHLQLDEREVDAQIGLWNSQAGLNDELKLKTHEEYEQLVKLYTLKREGVELSNDKIRAELKIDAKTLEVMERQIGVLEQQEVMYSSEANYHAEQAVTEQARRDQMEFQNTLTQETTKLIKRQRKWIPINAALGAAGSSAQVGASVISKIPIK